MRKIYTIVAALFILSNLYAQDVDVNSQYIFDNYMINPAAAGSKAYEPFAISFKKLWAGVEDSPITYSFITHRPITERMSVGAQISGYNIGVTSKLGLGLSYAYSIPIIPNKAKISVGLSALLHQYSLKQSGLTVEDPSDPLILLGDQSKMILDANLGTYFETEDIYAGIVIPQVASHSVDSLEGLVERFNVRNIFIHGGYRYHINQEHYIEPSLLCKIAFDGEVQVDVNVIYTLMEKFLFGLNYKTGESVGLILGVDIDMLYAAYIYDFGFSNIARYSQGSHEIVLAYKLFPPRVPKFGPRNWGFRAR